MDRNRIARRLGGAAVRRRRHRRVAAVLVVLLLAGLALVLVGGDDGDDTDDRVLAACRASNREYTTAFNALIRGNTAPTAAEEFLQGAFLDLSRDRSAAIRAEEPGDDVLAVVDEFDAVVDRIEDDPSIAIGQDPFVDVNERWQALGLDDCVIGGSTVPDS